MKQNKTQSLRRHAQLDWASAFEILSCLQNFSL